MTDGLGVYFETDFAADVFSFLGGDGQKSVPSKYLYDSIGLGLFRQIIHLPGHGMVRAEEQLLERYANELSGSLQPKLRIAHLAGTPGSQPYHLLKALRPRSIPYHPIDTAAETLGNCVHENQALEHVWVSPIQADRLPGMVDVASQRRPDEQLLVLLFGAAIGNYYPEMAIAFLRSIRQQMARGDVLMIGADLEKPIEPMLAAYNDPNGLCANFHLNLLHRINRELDGNFDAAQFDHAAIFNRESRSVETHLCSKRRQTVSIPKSDLIIELHEGESICTEMNRKYSSLEVFDIAIASGFHPEKEWVDEDWGFSENLLRAA